MIEIKEDANTKNLNIVSEFFSENVNYLEFEGTDLEDIFETLNKVEHKSNLEENKFGIDYIEKNNKYILLEFSSFSSKKIVKFEEGNEKEYPFLKLVKVKVYMFEEFVACIGDSDAIKSFKMFISEVFLTEVISLFPAELTMLNLLNNFKQIQQVICDRISHKNIKKITVCGNAVDICDFDINYSGYDINSICGVIYTGVGDRKIKITNNGKIMFYKKKDSPLYIHHLEVGYKLLTNQYYIDEDDN